MSTVVDLFAGVGWDHAARHLGLDPIGIELDADVCATRALHNMPTIRASASDYPPAVFGKIDGLIASPPCPQFSSAGNGQGRTIIGELCAGVADAMAGRDNLAEHRDAMAVILRAAMLAELDQIPPNSDSTGSEVVAYSDAVDKVGVRAAEAAYEATLTIVPALWILECDPDWVTFEQVPAALPIFRQYAADLRRRGYSVWVGVLYAEQFGVAQTRTRAVLMASRLVTIHPPTPTHQRYVHGEPAGAGADCQQDLFTPGVQPWVSMAEALGWGMTARPAVTVARGSDKGGGFDIAGGSAARDRLRTERDAGRWVVETGQNSARGGGLTERYERDIEAPAPTITGQARSWVLADRRPNGAERYADEPAPTIMAGHDNGDKFWLNTGRDQRPDGSRQQVDGDRPAPTLTAASGGQWTFTRPATTIACDSRVFQPGGHHTPGSQSQNAIRLAVHEALVLQSFPAEFALVGTKTARFKIVGNAVPPLLALHVLAGVLGVPVPLP